MPECRHRVLLFRMIFYFGGLWNDCLGRLTHYDLCLHRPKAGELDDRTKAGVRLSFHCWVHSIHARMLSFLASPQDPLATDKRCTPRCRSWTIPLLYRRKPDRVSKASLRWIRQLGLVECPTAAVIGFQCSITNGSARSTGRPSANGRLTL